MGTALYVEAARLAVVEWQKDRGEKMRWFTRRSATSPSLVGNAGTAGAEEASVRGFGSLRVFCSYRVPNLVARNAR